MYTLLSEGDSLSDKKGAGSVELFQKPLQYQLQRGRLYFAWTHLNQFISAQHDTRAKIWTVPQGCISQSPRSSNLDSIAFFIKSKNNFRQATFPGISVMNHILGKNLCLSQAELVTLIPGLFPFLHEACLPWSAFSMRANSNNNS